MKIAVGSDKHTHLTDVVIEELRGGGHEVKRCGVLRKEGIRWPDVALEVAEAVRSGVCDQGVLFCWTGTGVSIVANKAPGIRAALCADAETAKGAREYNNANILVMSLRQTSEAIAKEILDAWFSASFGKEKYVKDVARVIEIEGRYSKEM